MHRSRHPTCARQNHLGMLEASCVEQVNWSEGCQQSWVQVGRLRLCKVLGVGTDEYTRLGKAGGSELSGRFHRVFDDDRVFRPSAAFPSRQLGSYDTVDRTSHGGGVV